MLLNILDRFIEKCPAAVMVRATLERFWCPEKLDQIFLDASDRQYQKQLLFSQIVAIMAAVATRVHSSVYSAYLAVRDELGVSTTALYGKLNRLEPAVSVALVRETAGDAAQAIDNMPGAKRTVLKGLHVQYWTAIIWRPPNTDWRS